MEGPNYRVPEQVRTLSPVEPPLKFIEVTIKMLRGNLMIGTHDRPLEQAPNAFNGVRVNVAAHPFLLMVVDRFVLGVVVSDAAIGGPFVGHDPLSLGNGVLLDEAVKRLAVIPPLDSEPDVPAALNRTEHDRLIPLEAPPDVPAMPADVRLVNFDRSLVSASVKIGNPRARATKPPSGASSTAKTISVSALSPTYAPQAICIASTNSQARRFLPYEVGEKLQRTRHVGSRACRGERPSGGTRGEGWPGCRGF